MFNIKTFIKKPNVKIEDLNEVQINPEIYFINIDNSEEIKKLKQGLDIDYIEGAIIIEYGNERFQFKEGGIM